MTIAGGETATHPIAPVGGVGGPSTTDRAGGLVAPADTAYLSRAVSAEGPEVAR